jgi:hypothetical protein
MASCPAPPSKVHKPSPDSPRRRHLAGFHAPPRPRRTPISTRELHSRLATVDSRQDLLLWSPGAGARLTATPPRCCWAQSSRAGIRRGRANMGDFRTGIRRGRVSMGGLRAVATSGHRGCYIRVLSLLHAADAIATPGHRCYLKPMPLLHTGVAVATSGYRRSCLRPLSQATEAATYRGRRCYLGPPPLLPQAATAATYERLCCCMIDVFFGDHPSHSGAAASNLLSPLHPPVPPLLYRTALLQPSCHCWSCVRPVQELQRTISEAPSGVRESCK